MVVFEYDERQWVWVESKSDIKYSILNTVVRKLTLVLYLQVKTACWSWFMRLVTPGNTAAWLFTDVFLYHYWINGKVIIVALQLAFSQTNKNHLSPLTTPFHKVNLASTFNVRLFTLIHSKFKLSGAPQQHSLIYWTLQGMQLFMMKYKTENQRLIKTHPCSYSKISPRLYGNHRSGHLTECK